jgi:phospholipid/cholesterol/gamma-HCH transport system permease protein
MNVFAQIGRATLAIVREAGALAIFATRAAIACVRPPFYFDQLAGQFLRLGYFSLPVVGLTAIFIGAALALNIYVGGARFNAETFVPQIVVLGIARELGPVLAGLMLAGRVSAGVAAEIGTMRVTEQIDALSTLSTDPFRFLIAPRVLATTVSMPILVLIADIIGVMGGWLISISSLGFNGTIYIINTLKFLKTEDVLLGMTKAAVFGFIIATMGAYQGFRSSGGALGVGRAATNAVVASAVLILASNYVITSLWPHA